MNRSRVKQKGISVCRESFPVVYQSICDSGMTRKEKTYLKKMMMTPNQGWMDDLLTNRKRNIHTRSIKIWDALSSSWTEVTRAVLLLWFFKQFFPVMRSKVSERRRWTILPSQLWSKVKDGAKTEIQSNSDVTMMLRKEAILCFRLFRKSKKSWAMFCGCRRVMSVRELHLFMHEQVNRGGRWSAAPGVLFAVNRTLETFKKHWQSMKSLKGGTQRGYIIDICWRWSDGCDASVDVLRRKNSRLWFLELVFKKSRWDHVNMREWEVVSSASDSRRLTALAVSLLLSWLQTLIRISWSYCSVELPASEGRLSEWVCFFVRFTVSFIALDKPTYLCIWYTREKCIVQRPSILILYLLHHEVHLFVDVVCKAH